MKENPKLEIIHPGLSKAELVVTLLTMMRVVCDDPDDALTCCYALAKMCFTACTHKNGLCGCSPEEHAKNRANDGVASTKILTDEEKQAVLEKLCARCQRDAELIRAQAYNIISDAADGDQRGIGVMAPDNDSTTTATTTTSPEYVPSADELRTMLNNLPKES